MSLLVLGTVALDTVKTPAAARRDMLGGSAVHFAMSARIFTKVNIVGVIGTDFGRKHLDFLQKRGIDLSSLRSYDGKTFRWQGEYRRDMNSAKTISTHLGVLGTYAPKLNARQKSIKNVFLANIDPDEQRLILDSMYNPEFVGLDSMNYWIGNKKKQLLKIMKRVKLFVANEEEARSLTVECNLIKAAKGLLRLGPEMVIIKKGEHGAIFCSADSLFSLPSFPVAAVVDPTGAGDTFAGALLGYLATHKKKRWDIKRALAYAICCASFNVEGFGIETSAKLSRAKLESRLKRFKIITSF